MSTASAGVTCDTSVLVPALIAWHPAHERCREALGEVELVPGHVVLECYSVLTRLPAPHRIAPSVAAELVAALPFAEVSGPEDGLRQLVAQLGPPGVRGGATYDAAIGATARAHDLLLLTRDRRARSAYEAVGAAYRLL